MTSTPASRRAVDKASSARQWTESEIALLGTDSDAKVAKLIGRTQLACMLKRRKLGIPTHNPNQAPKGTWDDPRICAKLGQVPDADLAAELGLHLSTVWAARQARGIPAYAPISSRREWSDDSIIGTATDQSVADRLGVSRSTVTTARKRLGIAPMTATPETSIAAWQARLGLTDREAAARLGMTPAGYGRNKRGRDEHGRVRTPSRALLLACAAIEAGLSPIGPADQTSPVPARLTKPRRSPAG